MMKKSEAQAINLQFGDDPDFALDQFKKFADEETDKVEVEKADAKPDAKPVDKTVALADEDTDALINALPDVGAMPDMGVTPETEAIAEEVSAPVTGIDALIEKLDAIIKDKEAKKEDIKTAEDLKARLEELKAAEKNAQDFLDKTQVVAVEVDAVEGPLGGGAGTMEAEITKPPEV